MTLKNYLLIFGLIAVTAFTSCKKDEADEPSGADAPKITINGKSSGNIVDVPQNASSANNGQFNSAIGNVNQIGTFLTMLNSVPESAKATSRSTNSTVTYNWSTTDANGSYEVWYTVEEDGNNYNITYEIAISSADLTIPRTTYMSGWVAQNGQNGHLVFNFDAFTDGETNFNYTYNWDTNSSGDLHVLAYWNVNSSYSDIVYEATVYSAGGGTSEYRYTDDETNIVWHYEWNADWSQITWTYTVNGTEDSSMSGQWPA